MPYRVRLMPDRQRERYRQQQAAAGSSRQQQAAAGSSRDKVTEK